MLEFGLGKVCITPKMGSWGACGQIEQLRSDGVYADVFARSLYLGSSNSNIMIVSCDLCVLSTNFTNHIRIEISKKTGIKFDNIIIHTTHIHSGPVIEDSFGENKFIDKYIDSAENVDVDKIENKKIINGIINSGIKAFNSKRKGKIGIGKDYIYDISFNRRYIMKDGTIEMHPHKDDPNMGVPEGPNDPELNTIVVMDENNKIFGVITNFPCHLTFLERDNSKFSGDFPAYAEQYLMKYLNDNSFVMMFLNGACGNLCQVNPLSKNTVEVGDEYSRKVGEKFAKVVMKTVNNLKMIDQEDIKIKVNYKEIEIPVREVTEEMIKNAKITIKKYEGKKLKAPKLSNYGVESIKDKSVISANVLLETDFWKNMSAKEILDLYEDYKDNNLETVPLTVAIVGDIVFATIPGELFVEFSLDLREKLKRKYKSIFVISLANGYICYIPTKKAFSVPVERNAYEVQFLNSNCSKLIEDAGYIIVDKIAEMEKELR